MKWEKLSELGRELPEVVEGIWYRTPALKVRGKSFVRLKEDGQSVVFLLESIDEQEALIEAQSDVYFITDHYRGYPAVLARLAALKEAECRMRLERAYRLKAPRAVLKQLDARPAPAREPPAPRKPDLVSASAARSRGQGGASGSTRARRAPSRGRRAGGA